MQNASHIPMMAMDTAPTKARPVTISAWFIWLVVWFNFFNVVIPLVDLSFLNRVAERVVSRFIFRAIVRHDAFLNDAFEGDNPAFLNGFFICHAQQIAPLEILSNKTFDIHQTFVIFQT